MNVRVKLSVDLPQNLLYEFLQHIRDFDARHSREVTMAIFAACPDMKSADMHSILKRVKPPFPFSNLPFWGEPNDS